MIYIYFISLVALAYSLKELRKPIPRSIGSLDLRVRKGVWKDLFISLKYLFL